jgi:AAA domain
LLNYSQITALHDRLSTSRQAVGGIWGPPGTGKTYLAANEAVRAVTENDERVLVCAYENSTVDQTIRNIAALLQSRYGWSQDVVARSVRRTGFIARAAPDLYPYCTRNRHELAVARIVGTTLHSSYVTTGRMILQEESFDRVIMDESGQVTPQQAWIPLRLLRESNSSTMSVYGDDVQLTPISPDFVQEKSVLRRLRMNNEERVQMLDTTYRLNSPGVEMTSKVFYGGNLGAPQEVKNRRLQVNDDINSNQPRYIREAVAPENTLVYIGVKGMEIVNGLSCDNPAQAMVITDLCYELLRLGISPSRISVIAPYGAHVRTLRSILDGSRISCKTIHKMLGGENDVVILATTRSNASRDLGFVNQPELLNVATSRQLMKLILVGDNGETFSEGSHASKKIYDFILSKGCLMNNSI